MPFAATCHHHPEWIGDGTTDNALDHLHDEHPDGHLGDRIITFRYIPQVEAQGNPARRIYRCRSCATTMEAFIRPGDPEPPTTCEECTTP